MKRYTQEDHETFVVVWQQSDTIAEVIDKLRNLRVFSSRIYGTKRYLSKDISWARSRQTYMKYKGVHLKELPSGVTSHSVDWDTIRDLARNTK